MLRHPGLLIIQLLRVQVAAVILHLQGPETAAVETPVPEAVAAAVAIEGN
jgi:hypothetical protein